ncbi:aminotransferase class I/II-fold pyridoxal phosphate-dependent enzyme [Actinocorallia sp. API 0066]|uniref:aminotransferase class I/II-fold pyridoxal phosphate-dependent enzyme n=1 Tax=Actinocorallia sp. API 0066 TaxID=2896846 RepID=UPI001E5991B5|nr:aminotransferase class I/II-fold pyridoxal phosphate-dependent enzyme [Actinocorallia sp. API 0066]MCD0453407.1 aminotransferase class I/II-fold pyridoxal phosphate-dependent enzyme [Actinocorallia sp. API 0066]
MPEPSAFDRLRALLDGAAPPPGLAPIALHLGESRLALPHGVDLGPLADADGWTRYPPLGGTPELRAAYTGWLARRFGVTRALADGRVAVEPTAGTKHAVAAAVALAVARTGGAAPVVLPNPYYPTYRAATSSAGAEAVYYPADADVPAAVAKALADAGGHAAAVVLCDPANPGGTFLTPAELTAVAAHTAAAGALLIVDECYTDLSTGPLPPGFLSLVEHNEHSSFLVLHTLSKRSSMPGLRSGFAAGDPGTVAAFAAYNRACGVSMAGPVARVSAALWADEAHVARGRAALARAWDAADELLGGLPGYRRADAGFFLWLPVPDDAEAALALWREQALTVMPGRYLAAATGAGNPGAGHLRIALGHPEDTVRAALTRLATGLHGPTGRSTHVR